MKSPVTLIGSLLQDIAVGNPGAKGLDRDFVTIKRRFEHEGFSFLSVTLSSLCDSLDQGLSSGVFLCPSSFSKAKGTALPKFTSGLLSKVFDLQSGLLRADADVSIINDLRQLYRLFKKTVICLERTERLEREGYQKFLETEDSLRVHHIGDSRRRHLLNRVQRLVLAGLDNFHSYPIRSRHGPGAVYEGLHGNAKWRELVRNIYSMESLDFTDLDIFSQNVDDPLAPRQSVFSSVSRLVFVPKNSTSLRLITVEPLLRQFSQQGLNTVLRDEIRKCPILSQCLDLNSQVPNQVRCLEGSTTGEWCTIDLSSASDLLSNKLVLQAFDSKPLFSEGLQASRTPWVECKDHCIKLEKFAGMGNATTFPVQSVVFSLIGICAILDYEGKAPSYGNVRSAARFLRIFGDDIIIAKDYKDTLYSWLTDFALRVNAGKSFTEGFFRESCGVDAFRGVDITPIYVRSMPTNGHLKPEDLASIVSTSNQFWLKGFYRTANEMKNWVEKEGRALPLVNNSSSVLGWHTRLGWDEVHGWNKSLHYPYVKGISVVAKKSKDKIDGYAALLKFFMTPLIERGVKHLEVATKRYNTRLVSARCRAG